MNGQDAFIGCVISFAVLLLILLFNHLKGDSTHGLKTPVIEPLTFKYKNVLVFVKV